MNGCHNPSKISVFFEFYYCHTHVKYILLVLGPPCEKHLKQFCTSSPNFIHGLIRLPRRIRATRTRRFHSRRLGTTPPSERDPPVIGGLFNDGDDFFGGCYIAMWHHSSLILVDSGTLSSEKIEKDVARWSKRKDMIVCVCQRLTVPCDIILMELG